VARYQWWLLGGLATILLAGYLYFSLERYEERYFVDKSLAARIDPYLAAQRYLERRGVNIELEDERLNFDDISIDDIVFLSHADSLVLSQSQVDKAVAWIQRGGFLIVGVETEIEGYASLIKHYQIEPSNSWYDSDRFDNNGDPIKKEKLEETIDEINQQLNQKNQHADCKDTGQQSESTTTDSPTASECKSDEPDDSLMAPHDPFTRALLDRLNLDFHYEYYPANLQGIEDDLYLAVLDRITLDHPYWSVDSEDDEDHLYPGEIAGWIADDYGTRLIQINDGQGSLTALSSARLWQNDYIGLADHARILSYFVPDSARLHLFFNSQSPGLSDLIDRYLPEFYIISLLLLGLWLWRIALRIQPTTQVSFDKARDFGEHLRAGARFLLQNKQYQVMLESLKDDIDLQMQRYEPGFKTMNARQQAEKLAQYSALNQGQIENWLAQITTISNEADFVQAIAIGQTIRNKL